MGFIMKINQVPNYPFLPGCASVMVAAWNRPYASIRLDRYDQMAISKPFPIHCLCNISIILDRLHLKDMVSPRRHVEIEPMDGEVISVPVVHR